MKTNNILLILIILSFAGATWLITENHALKSREIDMLDRWFTMEEDLGNMQLEIFDMKTQMNRIESLIDEMAVDYSDTNTVNYN
jgi:hypothetical protein